VLKPGDRAEIRASRSAPLPARLTLALVGTAMAVCVVCAVGLVSLGNASTVARVSVGRQLALVDEAAAMSAFFYEKGFLSAYLLTGNRARLAQMDETKTAFEARLSRIRDSLDSSSRPLLAQIAAEYAAFDRAREAGVALSDAGHPEQARALLGDVRAHAGQVRNLFAELRRRAREDAASTMAAAEASTRRLAGILVGTSVAGIAASIWLGFLWARRIRKPIYELAVQVGSAAERTRIQIAPGRAGIDALGEQVAAIVEKLEATDAALHEHRRRLVQIEKLSAVGELATKLAHEVLNPLAGMKAAAQMLERHVAAADREALVETARAVDHEVTRVEGLVHRLMNYARPLAPRVEITTVTHLLDAAIDAAGPTLRRHAAEIDRRDAPDLPPLEVDPQLIAQALANVIVNAAEASRTGQRIQVDTTRAELRGRDEVTIRVRDQGPGISAHQANELFKPFFTTKSPGQGLGLAISQNILFEHGGRIVAGNRADGPGASFEIQIPVLR
jgi:signal transduction histidine kinase